MKEIKSLKQELDIVDTGSSVNGDTELTESLKAERARRIEDKQKIDAKIRAEMKKWREDSRTFLLGDEKTEGDECIEEIDDEGKVTGDHIIVTKGSPDMPQDNQTYQEWKGGLNLEKKKPFHCGEEAVDGPSNPKNPLKKLDIHYCNEEMPYCCDDVDEDMNIGDGSANHQSVNRRAKGLCFSNDTDVRCKTYAQGNHSHNFRWHYRFMNIGACNLRKHKFRQRQMWWKLYATYGAFREYFACMRGFRAEGYTSLEMDNRKDKLKPVEDEVQIPEVEVRPLPVSPPEPVPA